MNKQLISVGLDIGTTTSQMIVSCLDVANRASAFSVPEMEIANREVRYRGEVQFTPLLDESHVDGERLKEMINREYVRAGITRDQVDTGAIIVTGETSRRENARRVMEALAELAGDFVVATAGPDLESVLSAKGAGAVRFSEETEKTVLHMDIGGGTSNLTLIRKGRILATGCLNVGGRLVKIAQDGTVTYLSPVIREMTTFRVGEQPGIGLLEELAQELAQGLEMAAGLRPAGPLLDRLMTREAASAWVPPEEPVVLSFSGGVADCIAKDHSPFAFGDLGPLLGRAIRQSLLCRGEYRLGSETIRATVIGAGCHSAQLSGSTVFHRNVSFPLKNLPVILLDAGDQREDLSRQISRKQASQETTAVFALPGVASPGYRRLQELAAAIAAGIPEGPVYLCLEQDMAKALGQVLALGMTPDRPVLCLDRVKVSSESYLDIGTPVGPALPVVVKTLVLEQ